jgi:hypothetical protein
LIRWPGGALLCLLSGLAGSVEQIRVELGSIEAQGWNVQDAVLVLDLRSGEPKLVLHATHIQLGEQQLDDLKLDCQTFSLFDDYLECARAQLDFSAGAIRAESLPASFSWQFTSRQLKVAVEGLELADGKVDLAFSYTPQAWKLIISLEQTGVAGLATLARTFSVEVPDAGYQGSVSGSLSVTGIASVIEQVEWQLRSHALGYDNADGDQAAEGLQLSSHGRAQQHAGTWRVKASLAALEGVLYSEPLYLEFTPAQPLRLSAELDWQAQMKRLTLQHLSFDQPQQARGSLSASWRWGQAVSLENLQLQLDEAVLPVFYDTWLQPWLAGGAAGKLQTEGRLSGTLSLTSDALQAVYLDIEGVTLREHSGVFGIQDLTGELYWGEQDERHESTLSWHSANVYKLAFGPAELALQAYGRRLVLTQPLVVDLLDGQLHVDSFELGQDDAGFHWLLDGLLTPVSMRAFSTALGWMPLSGKLSGMIPGMRYDEGELTLGGVLLVRAFDGAITVRNLRIQQPFGLVPRLWADARINNLDLDTLTRTFDFGRIEGRLDGEVNQLYMEAWQTVAFDAWFKTPDDDRSRHRISQRAVDTISNIGGGGVSGAVSRSLLRFLEDFPYRRLGIRCRLENGTCQMGGVADLASGNGYYLVQGRTLPPRLDIIGYSREVDWLSLLDRLRVDGALQAAP